MTVVLVHGNPETAQVWDSLRAAWQRDDVVALSLPGFGCSLPEGFEPTMESYFSWLCDQIVAMSRPVHLIGHDWGGILTARLAVARPDLVASWASDAVGALHPKYEWHAAAQKWQTPLEGEASIHAMVSAPLEVKARLFTGAGLFEAAALEMASRVDAQMGACILPLYRSAAQPALRQWGESPERARVTRGAFLHAEKDPFVGAAIGTKSLAETMGAKTLSLGDVGHWWMLEDPEGSAQVLESWINRR